MKPQPVPVRFRLLRILPWLIVVTVVISCWFFHWKNWPATVVFVCRHADRAGQTDDLAVPLGTARAEDLARVLSLAGIDMILHSDTTRTMKTAKPLADQLGLTPVVYTSGSADLAATVRSNHRGKRVLIVGHSNTVPAIVQALGASAAPTIPDNAFGDLFELVIPRWGPVELVHMRYGAPSP